MAVTYVGINTATTGTASSAGYSVAIPTAAATLDVAILVVSQERVTPPPTPSGWTALRSETGSTSMATLVAWKRLVPGDLGKSVGVDYSSGSRRGSAVVLVFRGAADPIATTAAYAANGTSTLTSVGPGITPAGADAMLVGVVSSYVYDSNYSYTNDGTSSTGWTERADVISGATTTSNGWTYAATRLLSGGSGVAQPGLTLTATNPHFSHMATTISLTPGGPTGYAGEDVTGIEPGSTVPLVGTGSGAWDQPTGQGITILGSSGSANRSYVAPGAAADTTLTFTFGGDPVQHTVLGVTEFVMRNGSLVPGITYVGP